jgi:hypothetical protein
MTRPTELCPACGEPLFLSRTPATFGPGCVACAIASWSPERRQLAEAIILKTARRQSAAAELTAFLSLGR